MATKGNAQSQKSYQILSTRTKNSQQINVNSGQSEASYTARNNDQNDIASDIDPNLIYDPEERQLHILRQRMKKA